MLKIVFLLLLLANGVLFAFHQGYLESVSPSGHEPERMKNQLNADKIRLVATPAVPAVPASADAVNPAQAQAPLEPAGPTAACIEIGTFTAAEARRFETQLAALPLTGKVERLEVSEPSSHMVMIPPQGDKAGADRKVAELRALGVTDYYVLQDPPAPELRWGVSLGIFKSEEAARTYLTQVTQKGVRSARMIDYKTPMKKIAFQVNADSQARSGIEKLSAAFPNQRFRACPASGTE